MLGEGYSNSANPRHCSRFYLYRLFNSDKGNDEDFIVTTGRVLDSSTNEIFVVSVVTNSVPPQIQVTII